jgi:hypothetical protein
MTQENRDYVLHRSTGYLPGLIVIALGLLFLLGNLNVLPLHSWWQLWPVAVIAVGVTRLLDSSSLNQQAAGLVMIAAGGIFLAATFDLVPWSVFDLWPVALIGLGLIKMCEQVGPSRRERASWRMAERSELNEGFAVFSGFERRVTTPDFHGGEYSVIFGGGEIDLREAGMEADAAIIHVTAVLGGLQFRLPANWLLVNEVVGIFGGVEDKTCVPSSDAPGLKRLIVRGPAIFGGVSFKN